MKIGSMFKKLSQIVLTLALVGGIINTYGKAGEVKAETVDYSLYIDADAEKIYKNNSSGEELTESLKENLYFEDDKLVFDNFVFTSSAAKTMVVVSNNTVTIKLNGTNIITNEAELTVYQEAAAFYTYSSVVIEGDGTLNITNDMDYEPNSTFDQTQDMFGMYVNALTMKSGSLIVKINEAPTNGYALSSNGNLVVDEGASIRAVADIETTNTALTGSKTQKSYGIDANLIKNAGTVYSQGLYDISILNGVYNITETAIFESYSDQDLGNKTSSFKLNYNTSNDKFEEIIIGGEKPGDTYELNCNTNGCTYKDDNRRTPSYIKYVSKKKPLESVTFNDEKIILELEGEEQYIDLSWSPYKPDADEYEIISSNESVVKVVERDGNKYVKAVGNGTATLTVSTIYENAENVSGTIDVFVNIIEGVTNDSYMFLPTEISGLSPGIYDSTMSSVTVSKMNFVDSKLVLNNFEMFTANEKGALTLYGATTFNITGTNQIKVLESKVDKPAIYAYDYFSDSIANVIIEGDGSLFVNGFMGTLTLGENVNFESYSENQSYMGLEIVLSANDKRTIRGGVNPGETGALEYKEEIVYGQPIGYYVLADNEEIMANYIVIGEPTVKNDDGGSDDGGSDDGGSDDGGSDDESGTTVTETLDFNDKDTSSGQGWNWDSVNKVLELDEFNQEISTNDYAIKLPDGSTIKLINNSTNFIKSPLTGISGSNITIEGSGSLTIEAESYGISAGGLVPGIKVNGNVELNTSNIGCEGSIYINNGTVKVNSIVGYALVVGENGVVEVEDEVKIYNIDSNLPETGEANAISAKYVIGANESYESGITQVLTKHEDATVMIISGKEISNPSEKPGDGNTATGGDLPGTQEPIVPVFPSKPAKPAEPTTAVDKLDTTTTNVEAIITSGTVEEINKVVETTLSTEYLNVEINNNGVQYSVTDSESHPVRIDNINTVVTAILTVDEIVQAASGKLNASILLETEAVIIKNIPETIKAKIGDATPVGYQLKETVDISLYKVLGSEKTQVKETSAGVEVTMELPESIRNEKNVKIIRIHNEGTPEEEATVLTSVVNGDGTITFVTDKFSTYAFVTSDMDLSAYSNFGLEVYHNSRVISVNNTKNGFDVFGYMWADYVTPTKDTWREIIFVNTEDASTDKAYRMNAKAEYNTFLNSNMYATRDGKVDLSYACYKASVNTNSISSYDKKTTGKMASGTYYVFMRISDGKDSYLFPLVDRVLSDGSTMTLPANFSLSDEVSRTMIYTVK